MRIMVGIEIVTRVKARANARKIKRISIYSRIKSIFLLFWFQSNYIIIIIKNL